MSLVEPTSTGQGLLVRGCCASGQQTSGSFLEGSAESDSLLHAGVSDFCVLRDSRRAAAKHLSPEPTVQTVEVFNAFIVLASTHRNCLKLRCAQMPQRNAWDLRVRFTGHNIM